MDQFSHLFYVCLTGNQARWSNPEGYYLNKPESYYDNTTDQSQKPHNALDKYPTMHIL